MKKLTIITALVLGSLSTFAQGTYTCGGNSISYGAGELIDKNTAYGEIKHVYVEKNEATLVLNSIGIDEKTKDTLTFYSFWQKHNSLAWRKREQKLLFLTITSN